MKVTIQGWGRDHGKRTLLDAKLKDVVPRSNDSMTRFEQDTPYLLTSTDDEGHITRIKIASNAHIRANGNYLVIVSLTPTDVLYACWIAFKDRSLAVLTLNFAQFYRATNERRREMRVRHRASQGSPGVA